MGIILKHDIQNPENYVFVQNNENGDYYLIDMEEWDKCENTVKVRLLLKENNKLILSDKWIEGIEVNILDTLVARD